MRHEKILIDFFKDCSGYGTNTSVVNAWTEMQFPH